MTREAACSCGQLIATVEGDPVRVSVCHCLACQRRTGSAFGAQARFPAEAVQIVGAARRYSRLSDAGERRDFSFCPECGSTVFYEIETVPGFYAIPLGAFADPGFPPPTVQIWEERRVPWVKVSGPAG